MKFRRDFILPLRGLAAALGMPFASRRQLRKGVGASKRVRLVGVDDNTIVFGRVPSENLFLLTRRVQPLMDLLTQRLGTRVKSRVVGSYGRVLVELAEHNLDVATLGPQLYLKARAQGLPYRPVLARRRRGRSHYCGEIIIRKHAEISSLADLKGKRVAFVSRSSTTGFAFAAMSLRRAGVTVDDLAFAGFLGSHDNVVRAVANGDFDAGAVFENAAESLVEAGDDGGNQVRTLAKTDPIPNEPVIMGDRFREERPELAQAFIDVMVHLHESAEGRDAISSVGARIEGYVEIGEDAYDGVEAALRESEELSV